jgi:hypothetical protein
MVAYEGERREEREIGDRSADMRATPPPHGIHISKITLENT